MDWKSLFSNFIAVVACLCLLAVLVAFTVVVIINLLEFS